MIMKIKLLFILFVFLSHSVLATPTTKNIDKVEYYFWYGCGHCNEHNDEISSSLSDFSKSVKTEIIPAISSNKRWVSAAKAYYLGKNTANPDNFHKLMFKLVHIRGIDIMDEKTFMRVMDLYENMSNDSFMSLYGGTPMNDLVSYARVKTQKSGITSVPTVRIIYKNGNSRNYSFSDKPSGMSFSNWIDE